MPCSDSCVPTPELKDRFVSDVRGLKDFLSANLDISMVYQLYDSLDQVEKWAVRYSQCLMHRVPDIGNHFKRIMRALLDVRHPQRGFVMRLVQDLWMRADAKDTLPPIECLTQEGLYENKAITSLYKRRKELVAALKDRLKWNDEMTAQLNRLDLDRLDVDIWPSDVLTANMASQFLQARNMFAFARNRQAESNFLLEQNIAIITRALIDGARHRGFSIIALVMNEAFKPLVDFDTKEQYVGEFAAMYDEQLVTKMPTVIIPKAPVITTAEFDAAWKFVADMSGVC